MEISQLLTKMYFGNTFYDYLIFLVIILGGIIVGKTVYYISKNFLLAFAQKSETKLDDVIINSIHGPLVFLIFVIAFNIGYRMLVLTEAMQLFFQRAVSILVVVNITWFLLKFMDELIVHYLQPLTAKTSSDLDDHLVPILRKLVKVLLCIIASVMILDEFGYNVTSILAGLGIGGLAFAFAAKDILANVFGGVTILSDKPFKIGQRIRIDKFDGTVEEVGLRSTKIRTLEKTQLIIPNMKFTDQIVENVTREEARKVTISLGITYDTSTKKMEKAIELIKEIIKNHKTTTDKYWVYFKTFGDSSLNLEVIYYINSKEWDDIAAAKNDINFEIKKKFDQYRIEFAFPTRTVYMKK